MMYILGLNAYHPDSSACIIADGKLIAMVEEERFRRIKHWSGLPVEAVKYCLGEAGIGLESLDYIVFNRDPKVNLFHKAGFVLSHGMPAALVNNRLRNAFKFFKIRQYFNREFGVPENAIRAKVFNIEHHHAHLSSAFFVSPFDNSAVVSIDGFGDFSSSMVAEGRDNKIKVISGVHYPHSLGIFYTAFTQFLGFNKFGDEFKVMGLAAYGKPKFADKINKLLALGAKGKYKLNLKYFSFFRKNQGMLWDNTEPVLEDVFSSEFIKEFGPPRKASEELSSYHSDLAASLQVVYEKGLFHVLNYAYEVTANPRLCFSGGCALNSLANGKIFDNTPFKEIFIQPASSDSGGSIGAAYYLYNQIMGKKRNFVMRHPFWGPLFTDEEIKSVLDRRINELSGCVVRKLDSGQDICRNAAGLIAEGKVVGWFQGRMEIGPRALGNRSILADPRNPKMKDILNTRIKKREWFRPFAPAILAERTGEYFEKDYPDPFMLKVYLIQESKRNVIPAVTHADGTGRLQTVSKAENPLFWQLIKEFDNITGVPVVLNTSFNENEPIVLNPEQALECFLRTRMDALFMGYYFINRNIPNTISRE